MGISNSEDDERTRVTSPVNTGRNKLVLVMILHNCLSLVFLYIYIYIFFFFFFLAKSVSSLSRRRRLFVFAWSRSVKYTTAQEHRCPLWSGLCKFLFTIFFIGKLYSTGLVFTVNRLFHLVIAYIRIAVSVHQRPNREQVLCRERMSTKGRTHAVLAFYSYMFVKYT